MGIDARGELSSDRTSMEGGRRMREGARAKPPLVSIVTVVFRAAQELPPLAESIVAHRGEDAEWIVIDGGSDDGTLDFLRRFDDSIDYWISESDGGIYEAMNKGVAAATGEYVVHLNAGDRLCRIPREELERCLADQVDLACFAVDMTGFGIHRPRSGRFLARIAMIWHHQGCFYRREGHMGYDTQYRMSADFDLNQRMIIAGKSIRCFFNTLVSKMVTVGISANGRPLQEHYHVIRKNFGQPYVWIASIYFRLAPIIPPLKRLQDYLKSLFHRVE